jgi:hypothetical protein
LAEKYRYTFSSLGFETCVVRFDFAGYSGASTTLTAADRPFVLSEFNTEEDIFKPVRPQVAEMSFIASASGVSIDDFLADNDDDITVYFDFGANTNYWVGYLSQDDFQEVWQDTEHIITLRATDGIGYLKNNIITDSGSEFQDLYTPLETIIAAMGGTALDFGDYYVYSSLYHDSMDYYTTNYSGLEQCYINGKTFATGQSKEEYDDAYTALEKINQAFSQTIFQYNGKWRILRVEDMFVPTNQNIVGYRNNNGTKSNASGRFDSLVSVTGNQKPISPEMLRFVNRKPKYLKTKYDYSQNNEIVKNQSFSRGAFDANVGFNKIYFIDDWTYGPTVTTARVRRSEVYGLANSVILDTYMTVVRDASTQSYVQSEPLKVFAAESFNINIDSRFETNFTTDIELDTFLIYVYDGTNYKYLLADGEWSNLETFIKIKYNGTDGVNATDWTTTSIDTSFPISGELYILLIITSTTLEPGGGERQFKGININYNTSFNTVFNIDISGVNSVYTKSQKLRNSNEYDTYFDDGVSHNYKGSIYEQNQSTLTDLNWFRGRYPAERIGFRRQNATARWMNERFDRSKIDATFYGLTFDSGTKPVGLLQTIRFVDDDPDKIYWISNLKEIDFNTGIWSASLLEIWDDNRDSVVLIKDFEAEPINGNYIPSGEFTIPFSIISAADFTYSSITKQFTYNGLVTLTDLLICNINGDINTIDPSNTTATFKLYINDVVVDTDTHDASTTPSIFSISLNGTYTINPNENLYVTISTNVGDFDVNGGELSMSYEYPADITYDTYTDEYIYK